MVPVTESHPELNGSAPEPTEAQQTGQAVANALMPLFMQILPQVLGQAVQQGQRRGWCAQCALQRMQWEDRHKADMDAALELAAKAAGIADSDPRRPQLDVGPFLPAHMQPRSGDAEQMPLLADWVTQVGGTLVCARHIPGAPAEQGKRPFLIAHGAMTPGMLAEMGAQPV